MIIDRKDLYDQIWATPASQLCKRFGFSDVWLAKLCKRHGIPRPPRGYWAKKRNGIPTRRIPLPRISDETLEKIDLTPRPAPEKQTISPVLKKSPPKREPAEAAITVNSRLTAPHPLVDRTRKSLNASLNLDSSMRDRWGLISTREEGCLDVAVGPESIDRAMRILDALIKALEARKCRVQVPGEEFDRRTLAEVDGKLIRFRLTEKVQMKLRPPSPDRVRSWLDTMHIYIPSGEFRLQILSDHGSYTLRTWKDGKRKRIEDQLNDFIVGLVEASEQMKASREYARLARIEEERKRRIREEADRLRREEEERVRWVEATLDSWERWRSLGRMIRDARNRASRLGRRITPESRMGRWIETAERRLAKLDPLAPMVNELPPSTPVEGRLIEEKAGTSVDDLEGEEGPPKG
ncbi:hypothetical protein [Paludisphaera borealis]|uniref:Uncharacterized protein n=1 Tax=Paludisphaera borealis TaxID=1387353 RepID=A0A1U7CYN1_9BACT|nr:hypothetical protein [Paludisphaera borealis]APW63998.1 hypothetical protein BSF38_05586 [Paludisphaera borealis]